MQKGLRKSACLIICLTMVMSVSAYSAELAKAEACISIAGELSSSSKAESKAGLEKYNYKKLTNQSRKILQNTSVTELKSEVSYAIIPDNPIF